MMSLVYMLKTCTPPLIIPLIHAWEILCLRPFAIVTSLSSLTPMPFRAPTMHPPDGLSASVHLAGLRVAFHPSVRACLLASLILLLSITFVPCVHRMSADEKAKILSLAVDHALALAESTAHHP